MYLEHFMPTPEENKFIYYLTDLKNLDFILKENGLLSRNSLTSGNYSDIADHSIINKRGKLNDYVPFHFFIKNPFDGAMLKSNRDKSFMYIGISRIQARKYGFRIVPIHPLSMCDRISYSYDEGYEKLNWDLINTRDYTNHNCKEACMSECLCEDKVDISLFGTITVKTEENKKHVEMLLKNYNVISIKNVYANPHWFV